MALQYRSSWSTRTLAVSFFRPSKVVAFPIFWSSLPMASAQLKLCAPCSPSSKSTLNTLDGSFRNSTLPRRIFPTSSSTYGLRSIVVASSSSGKCRPETQMPRSTPSSSAEFSRLARVSSRLSTRLSASSSGDRSDRRLFTPSMKIRMAVFSASKVVLPATTISFNAF